MTAYDLDHLEKTALAMTKKNWSDQASQDFDDAFRPAVALQLVRDLQGARRNERHNREAWGKAEARLLAKDEEIARREADRVELVRDRIAHRELLQRLHIWFHASAPEHYVGCGLYIDIEAALTSGVIPTPAGTGGDDSHASAADDGPGIAPNPSFSKAEGRTP